MHVRYWLMGDIQMAMEHTLPQRFDRARVQTHIEESRSHFQVLEENWDSLLAQHEGDWVAAYKGEFKFGKTIRDVLAAARDSGWPLDVIAIDHLSRRRPAVLL